MDKSFVGFGFAFETLNHRPYSVLADRREHLPGFISSLHRHDFFQIWYCCKGSYFHKVEDQVYECKEGSVIILPMGTSHYFWNVGEANSLPLQAIEKKTVENGLCAVSKGRPSAGVHGHPGRGVPT